MKKKVKCFQIFQTILFAVSWTTVSGAENLNEAWTKALDHDLRLKSARESSAAAQESLLAAKSLRFPSLKGEAALSRLDEAPETEISLPRFPVMTAPILNDETFLYSSATLSVPLFTSGRISSAIDSAESAAEATKADEKRAAQEIKLIVAETYISVLRAENAVKVAKSNVNTLSAHALDVNNFFNKGLVAKNDILSVNVALSDAQQLEIQAKNRLDIAKASFNRLTGRPLTREVCLDDIKPESSKEKKIPETYEDLIKKAMLNRPEIKALSDQTRALEYHAKSIRASALPQVLASGSFHHFDKTTLEEENIWAATLGVKWDIFDGGVTMHQARSADQKRMAAESLKKDTESLIELQVRQAWLDVNETAKRIEVATKALDQAEENLKVAKSRYIQEIGSNTEVLDAETLRIKSLTNHNNAVYDSVMADMRLRRAVGDL